MKLSKYLIIVSILLSFFLITPAFSSTLLPYPRFKATDSSGVPYAGGKVYTYRAGTSTSKVTYSNMGCTTANANPVILDANGEATIWLKGNYKIILKTPADVTVWTLDNVQGMGGSGGADCLYADASEVDQGVTGLGNTIKAFVDTLGANYGSICLDHVSGATSTYTVTTPLTIPANVRLKISDGARLTKSGAGTMTINGPFEAGLYQGFSGFAAGDITFGPGSVKEAYPQWWGATALAAANHSATTATTLAIQAMFKSGANRGVIPDGYYMIDADTTQPGEVRPGLSLPSNFELVLEAGTFLQAINMAANPSYAILLIWDKSNVVIHGNGGTLIGDSDYVASKTLTPSTGGVGLWILGSTNVWVYDLNATKVWGDGISVGYDDLNSPWPESQNVNLINCNATVNYRNGASIIGAIGGGIYGGKYSSNDGTSPESGIDVEPNADKDPGAPVTPSVVSDFTVRGVTAASNAADGIMVNAGGTIKRVLLEGNFTYLNGTNGINAYLATDLVMRNNISHSNSQAADNTSDNIYIKEITTGSCIGNVVRQGSETNKPKYGINNTFVVSKRMFLSNNDTRDGGKTANIYNETDTVSFVNNFLRRSLLTISDGTNASTIKPTLISAVNGDAISVTDNVAKGATTGHYALSADGYMLTILNESGGIEYPTYMVVSVSLRRNLTTTDFTIEAYANDTSSHNIRLFAYNTATGAELDWTALLDISGNLGIYITYMPLL